MPTSTSKHEHETEAMVEALEEATRCFIYSRTQQLYSGDLHKLTRRWDETKYSLFLYNPCTMPKSIVPYFRRDRIKVPLGSRQLTHTL